MRPARQQARLAEIVGRRQWFNVPVGDINSRLRGDINYGNGRTVASSNLRMKFWSRGGASSYPWKSLDTWFVAERTSAGWNSEPTTDIKALVERTNRSDLAAGRQDARRQRRAGLNSRSVEGSSSTA